MGELTPVHAFGINTNASFNDNFVVYELERGQEQIAFPVGTQLAAFDSQSRTISFFASNQNEEEAIITSLTLSPDECWIAAAYCGTINDDSQVFVYRASNRKKMVQLCLEGRVSSLCFSGDSKSLISVTGESLQIWTWERQKVDYSAAITGINRISCPPKVSGSAFLASSTGTQHCRLWMTNGHRISNTRITLNEAEELKHDFRDHAWISNSDDKKLMLFAVIMVPLSNEREDEDDLSASSVNIYKIVDGMSSSRPRIEFDQAVNLEVKDSVKIATISMSCRGFVLGGTGGIYFYDKQKVSQQKYSFAKSGQIVNANYNEIISIKCRASDPNRLLLLSSAKTIYQVDSEISPYNDNETLEECISSAGHIGSIDNIECCVEKPYIVSSGKDGQVKIWDYEQKKCLMTHIPTDQPKSIAVHPSGYQIIAGYKNKLIMYHILANSLKSYREERSVSEVTQLEFSPGGNMIAAIVGSTIYIYPTYQESHQTTFQMKTSFTGHVGPIENLVWATNHSFLTTGSDRNIYGWDIIQGCRIDNFNILCSYGSCISLAVASSFKSYDTAVSLSDGSLHKLSWNGKYSEESKSFTLSEACEQGVTAIALNQDKTVLFAAIASGIIRVYNWKISDDNTKYYCRSGISLHSSYPHLNIAIATKHDKRAAVTRMKSTRNILVSAGEDGSIFLSKVKLTKPGENKHDNTLFERSSNAGSVLLLTSDEYDTKHETIEDLKNRVQSLKADFEFQLHSKQSLNESKLQDLSAKTERLIKFERERYSQLKEHLSATIEQHTHDLASKDTIHLDKIRLAEERYEERITDELQRYNILKDEMTSAQILHQSSTQEERRKFKDHLKEVEERANKESKDIQSQVVHLKRDIEESDRVFKEILDQQEEEYEMELLNLRGAQDRKLKEEASKIDNVKFTLQTVKSKRSQLIKQNEELRKQNVDCHAVFNRERDIRMNLEDVVKKTKLEIAECRGIFKKKSSEVQNLSLEKNALKLSTKFLESQVEELNQAKIPIRSKLTSLEHEITAVKMESKKNHDKLSKKDIVIAQNEARLKSNMRSKKQAEDEIRALKRELILLSRVEDMKVLKSQLNLVCEKRSLNC